MSCIFGRWNFDGRPVDAGFLEKVRPVVSPYGPDGNKTYCDQNVAILYHAFHTTGVSRRETQPYIAPSGAIITWDGRLDNSAGLIEELGGPLKADATDVEVVAAAYERWGTGSFAKLIGDWALVIWNPKTQSLTLAKDFIGIRHLYYCIDKDQTTWSTILDPLVLFAGKKFKLCEEYVAGWFSLFPAAHLTPYAGIHAVSPASFVTLSPSQNRTTKYWDFDPEKRIRYSADTAYEEHFLSVFQEAVRRRLRSCDPVLSELSGGMDSSSIVCMADTIIGNSPAQYPRLDTVSYYDDSEPNWNERPYFTKVEEKRGRTGCHIDMSTRPLLPPDCGHFTSVPGLIDRNPQVTAEFAKCLLSNSNRVVLSGIGGDEVMGGVPTPVPELVNLLARADFRRLAHQLKLWALDKRKPWFYVLFEAVTEFIPLGLIGVPEYKRPAKWLNTTFVARNRSALLGYPSRVKLFGPLPSFQLGVSTLETLRREFECIALPSQPTYETRYPYLDRDLMEFMLAVPREQVVRPGRRRSLMRRSLIGTVPTELLERRRKAFVVRGPMNAISGQFSDLLKRTATMVSDRLEIVNVKLFESVLQAAHNGMTVPLVTVLRTLTTEMWLTSIKNYLSDIGSARKPLKRDCVPCGRYRPK